jgi:hypothetical protein
MHGSLSQRSPPRRTVVRQRTSPSIVEDFTIRESEQTAKQVGAFNLDKIHVPNTKKTLTLHGVTILQWRDGKVVRQSDWANGQELDQQLQIRSAAPSSAAKAARGGRMSRVTTEG